MRGVKGKTVGELHFDSVQGGTYRVHLGGPTGEMIGYVLSLGRNKWKARVKGVVVVGLSRVDAVRKALQKLEKQKKGERHAAQSV